MVVRFIYIYIYIYIYRFDKYFESNKYTKKAKCKMKDKCPDTKHHYNVSISADDDVYVQ